MAPEWYDREGQPLNMTMVDLLLGTPGYKRVAHTEVTSASDEAIRYRISTVWLGLDHNFGEGEPLIFETMVFPGEGTGDDGWADTLRRRYPDEMAAKLGHEETVVLVAATVPDEVITHEP